MTIMVSGLCITTISTRRLNTPYTRELSVPVQVFNRREGSERRNRVVVFSVVVARRGIIKIGHSARHPKALYRQGGKQNFNRQSEVFFLTTKYPDAEMIVVFEGKEMISSVRSSDSVPNSSWEVLPTPNLRTTPPTSIPPSNISKPVK